MIIPIIIIYTLRFRRKTKFLSTPFKLTFVHLRLPASALISFPNTRFINLRTCTMALVYTRALFLRRHKLRIVFFLDFTHSVALESRTVTWAQKTIFVLFFRRLQRKHTSAFVFEKFFLDIFILTIFCVHAKSFFFIYDRWLLIYYTSYRLTFTNMILCNYSKFLLNSSLFFLQICDVLINLCRTRRSNIFFA